MESIISSRILQVPLFISLTFIVKLNPDLHFHDQTFGIWFDLRISRKRWDIGQTLLLPSNTKSCLDFRWVSLHLTLAHSKDEDQKSCTFQLRITRKWWYITILLLPSNTIDTLLLQTLLLPSNRKHSLLFEQTYLHFTLIHSKGQAHAPFVCEYLMNLDR